jgi:hypothetical protein
MFIGLHTNAYNINININAFNSIGSNKSKKFDFIWKEKQTVVVAVYCCILIIYKSGVMKTGVNSKPHTNRESQGVIEFRLRG